MLLLICEHEPGMTHDRDDLYQSGDAPQPFRFDQQVARVFPDMIHRSVPGYALMLEGIQLLTAHQARPGTVLYDLGCSLGDSALMMLQAIQSRKDCADCRIVAVDQSPDMLNICRQRLESLGAEAQIETLQADILDLEFESSSVITLNLVLQFLPRDARAPILRRAREALKPGGVLILCEKVHSQNTEEQALWVDLHHNFKRSRGYSELEIAGKRAALENVLLTESRDLHFKRLHEVGFSRVSSWFHCFNFCGMAAFVD